MGKIVLLFEASAKECQGPKWSSLVLYQVPHGSGQSSFFVQVISIFLHVQEANFGTSHSKAMGVIIELVPLF